MTDLQDEILKKHNIIIHSYKDNHVDDIQALLKKINVITDKKQGSIIQLLDTSHVCGIDHVMHGISEAIEAFSVNQNFAKDKGLEVCVRMSAQKQISEALKILGIKKNSNITVIYINTTTEQIKQVEDLMGMRDDDLINKIDVDKIIKAYHLDSGESLKDKLREKIAMLKLV